MTRPVVIAPTAEAQVEQIVDWISDFDPDAAVRWYHGLKAAIQSLASLPERFGVLEDLPFPPAKVVREMLYGRRRYKYRVWYVVEPDQVRIVGVRHPSRGPIDPSELDV